MYYDKYFAQPDIMQEYITAVDNVGLWNAEKRPFLKYVSKDAYLLDIGTGAGRVAFGLYRLGYSNIAATDFCKEILDQAIETNEELRTNIKFMLDDITDTKLESNQFDAIMFSFNGFIIVPGEEKRLKALSNIHRLLKQNGIFILSTDNRRTDKKFDWFWKKELNEWKIRQQDKRINHFGEIIYSTDKGDMYFWHPKDEELVELLNKNGFLVIDDYNVGEKYKESPEVLKFCGGKNVNHIWVTKKII
jgi:SAM-dependent methyltransferase